MERGKGVLTRSSRTEASMAFVVHSRSTESWRGFKPRAEGERGMVVEEVIEGLVVVELKISVCRRRTRRRACCCSSRRSQRVDR